MAGKSPLVTLNNGVQMPALGLGALDRSTLDKIADAVEAAMAKGYRLVDTAAAYNSERQVAEGIARSGVDRSEVFVTTKLWLSDYGYDSALRAFELSLRKLGSGYVDLYLLHWPLPSDFEATIESFRAAVTLLAEGQVRAVGVSNFGPRHLETLIERTGVVPAVNQVELHPSFTQRELRAARARLGIVTQSWSPLGNSVRRAGEPGAAGDPLAHPTVVGLAARHRKIPAQVVLRWHLQHGLSAIPKSVRPERVAENIDVFDFALSAADMAAIDAMDTGARSSPDPDAVHAATFPIRVEDEVST